MGVVSNLETREGKTKLAQGSVIFEERKTSISFVMKFLAVLLCMSGTGGSATTPSAGTTPATYTCMNCTGDEASDCGRGDSTTVTTTVTCDACWAYRDENTTSGGVTFIRGCAQESAHTCNDDSKNEQCNTAGDITRCWRCCTSADECNDSNLELLGQPSGAADVHVSVVVTMASTLCAIVALWQ
uniref:Uncharacterized protein n=1 Tax=Branchiostoma floridae TaxID=7739 RepID=C3Z6Z5_BRAFL|eukprot:XP_002595579.1 hypothetical protein BRAFLDRAFT_64688 [Branchiostoma floridae]